MAKLFIIASVIVAGLAVLEAGVPSMEVPDTNMMLNLGMYLLVAALGFFMRLWIQGVTKAIGKTNEELNETNLKLTQIATKVEMREAQQVKIDYLEAKVTDALVAIARLEAKK